MIKLTNGKIPSGDYTQVDVGTCDKGQLFLDDNLGVLAWDGSVWLQTGLAPVDELDDTTLSLSTSDFKFDTTDPDNVSLYIEFTKVVVEALLNGQTFDFRQDFNYTPARIYGFANNAPQTLELTHKI